MSKKEEAYYFSHDSNARHDQKIVKMETKYPDGYGWFFKIVEILREQSDYRYTIDEYCWTAISRDIHVKIDVTQDFIRDCINEFHLFETDGKSFWSNSLLRRMKRKDEISNKRKKSGKKGAMKRWNKSDSPVSPSNGKTSGDSKTITLPIANEKQTDSMKGKEKKGNERKRNICVEHTHTMQKWIEDNAPRVNQLKEKITYEQCENIKNNYKPDLVKKVLLDMENYKPLLKKYTSANLTLQNWLRRENEKISGNREQKPKGDINNDVFRKEFDSTKG